MIKRAHILVSGRVQGVGFRCTVSSWAKSLELDGWVSNRPDGGVEIMAQGALEAVQSLIQKIKSGSPGRVSNCSVEFEKPEEGFFGFEIK
ncbi:MAG: acylphosphatase [Candidatus ainarchaeum sp.]|nr:acylphosphatase [Candidatus ainarchaeum sp.]